MQSLSIFLVLLTNLLHLTLAHISKVDSHGHSFYSRRNLTAIHHANFLSFTPRLEVVVVAAAAAAGISNMTFSEYLAVRSGPLPSSVIYAGTYIRSQLAAQTVTSFVAIASFSKRLGKPTLVVGHRRPYFGINWALARCSAFPDLRDRESSFVIRQRSYFGSK